MRTYTFNISLSILNHLGRNLYRSFITVLGEAISNSWDADATNVSISIDREQNTLIITDDGVGVNNIDILVEAMQYAKKYDIVMASHAGDIVDSKLPQGEYVAVRSAVATINFFHAKFIFLLLRMLKSGNVRFCL